MADIVNPGQIAGGTLNTVAMPQNQDLVIYKGDTLRFLVNVVDSNGVAKVLTGSTPKASLKTDYNDRSPRLFECTLTGTAGQVAVVLPATTTSTMLPGSYIYDFQITYADGTTRTYLTGDVTVYNEVTT